MARSSEPYASTTISILMRFSRSSSRLGLVFAMNHSLQRSRLDKHGVSRPARRTCRVIPVRPVICFFSPEGATVNSQGQASEATAAPSESRDSLFQALKGRQSGRPFGAYTDE